MTSIEMLSEFFFGLSKEREKMLYEGKAWESVLISRELFSRNPSFAIFYFRWRLIKSPMQQRLQELEKKYQIMLKKAFPTLTQEKILVLHAINQAVVTSPYLSAESLVQMHGLLLGLW